MYSLALFLHHCLSSSLKYWKCLPHYSAFAFFSHLYLIPHSYSSSHWRSKWRQRSSLLSSSSVAKLDACSIHRYLQAVKPPALESQCADLLLICGMSVSSTTGLFTQEEQEGNPHYKLCQGHRSHHTNLQASAQTYTYILFSQLLQTPRGKSPLLGRGNISTIAILKGEENHCNL